MIVRNKKNGTLRNIAKVTVNHIGDFDDLINHSTCAFFYNHTDPKVGIVKYMDENGVIHEVEREITSAGNFQGSLADLRYKLVKKRGCRIISFSTYFKPEKMQKDEQACLTYGVIQNPILYTIIFNYPHTKGNE